MKETLNVEEGDKGFGSASPLRHDRSLICLQKRA